MKVVNCFWKGDDTTSADDIVNGIGRGRRERVQCGRKQGYELRVQFIGIVSYTAFLPTFVRGTRCMRPRKEINRNPIRNIDNLALPIAIFDFRRI